MIFAKSLLSSSTGSNQFVLLIVAGLDRIAIAANAAFFTLFITGESEAQFMYTLSPGRSKRYLWFAKIICRDLVLSYDQFACNRGPSFVSFVLFRCVRRELHCL